MYVFLTMRENSKEACYENCNEISERRDGKKESEPTWTSGINELSSFVAVEGAWRRRGSAGLLVKWGW
jgi:hypothetical protein